MTAPSPPDDHSAVTEAPDGTRLFKVDDLVAIKRISDPQPSPDGRKVAFVLQVMDMAANRGRTELWLAGLDGRGLRRLTAGEADDSNPRWSPDGRWIYYLSSLGGSSQVWKQLVAGGAARQVTDLPVDLADLVVSPDGAHLAFTAEVFAEAEDLEATRELLAGRRRAKPTGQLYERLFVRHWDAWKDGRYAHVFVIPAAGGEEAGAKPVDLTRGWQTDVPVKPAGGTEDIVFTPDGTGLVFAARSAGRAEAWSTGIDLYYAPIDGSARPMDLTSGDRPGAGAVKTRPLFSPDGHTLVYLSMERSGYESDCRRIVRRSWAMTPEGPALGTATVVAEGWDRSVDEMTFARDGDTLYLTARHGGQAPLFAVGLISGEVRALVPDGTVRSPAAAAGGKVIFELDHLRSPAELHTLGLEPGSAGVRRITQVNSLRLAKLAFGQPEQFHFTGADGDTVWGWVVKPAGFEAGERYPVALLIHGGPHGSFGNTFHYRWNPQIYAGHGYAVVMVDFHGSAGYGQAFADSIGQDWGGKPLEDLREGLAAALERYPWLDGRRVGALGASYGGFLIYWIAGQWPDRFRCLVSDCGIFDQRMMYYATDELWFPEWEQAGSYYESPEVYERHNPALHVKHWRTPMLVIHGALDYRVPLTQGLGAFTALQRRGIPSQFLYFPDEGHWVLKPHNTIQWHETVLAWMDRWLKGNHGTGPIELSTSL